VLRSVFGMTDAELGFPVLEVNGCASVPMPLALSREGLAYFETLLLAHIDADNLLGPQQVLTVVEHEAHQLNIAARDARGTLRRDVIKTAVRFQEFLGWVQQDTGLFVSAMASTDRARDLAAELGDPLCDAYLLMRKSNIATDAADPATGAALAEAALIAAPARPPRLHAVILRQKANAQAALGDVTQCASAVDLGLTVVQHAEADGAEIASYCTERYVAMEAAACWTQLGQPARAVQLFNDARQDWPDTQRRDKGLYLARLATAHAGVGDIARATSFGTQAVEVAGVTRSARAIAELRRFGTKLFNAQSQGEAEALCAAVASLVGTAA